MQKIFYELVAQQRQKLLEIGEKIRPNLTEEDLLQPNDYPELEDNPLFRYEEGILAGILTVKAAWLAFSKQGSPHQNEQ